MSFYADKQTLEDLNLLGRYKPSSIYNLFNKVQTDGGARLLEKMFNHPLSDPAEINLRVCTFKYFHHLNINFPLNRKQLLDMESYLHFGNGESLFSISFSMLRKKMLKVALRDEQYDHLMAGLHATINVLILYKAFLDKLFAGDPANPYSKTITEMKGILNSVKLKVILNQDIATTSSFKLIRYHHFLSVEFANQLEQIMTDIYFFDVCIAVGHVARSKGFTYAAAMDGKNPTLSVIDLKHPGVENAVVNTVDLSDSNNLIFLTGANMAGKSTLMKALGVNFYLAHMGFPVAAREMKFSVNQGIYSSINVPDDLNKGYSHFYAEVLRVKKVAEEVSSGKKLLVIFDELFKGTNVNDAFDATLEVTAAFSAYRSCFFIISTHITEVGEMLHKRCDHLQSLYLPTVMQGTVPIYTYLLQPGISSDRQGMTIIENEGILELLKD